MSRNTEKQPSGEWPGLENSDNERRLAEAWGSGRGDRGGGNGGAQERGFLQLKLGNVEGAVAEGCSWVFLGSQHKDQPEEDALRQVGRRQKAPVEVGLPAWCWVSRALKLAGNTISGSALGDGQERDSLLLLSIFLKNLFIPKD